MDQGEINSMNKIIATSHTHDPALSNTAKNELTAWPLLGWLLKKGFLMTGLRLFACSTFVVAIITGLLFNDARVGLATLVFWGIFWPLLTAIVTPSLGNLFCGICPHGFIGKKLNKLGLQRSFPKKLKGIWGGVFAIVLGYWVIAYAMPGFLSSSTRNTAIYFTLFTLAAFTIFFIYKDMAWCKHICPLGRVLSTHGKIGILQIQTDQNDCNQCKSFDCVKACSYHLSPFNFEKRNNMGSCTLCMDCITACNSVKLVAKTPGSALKAPIANQNKYEMWVFVIILGVAGVGIQFLHGLQHTPLKPYLPWTLLGDMMHGYLPVNPESFNIGRLLALVMGLGITLTVSTWGYWKASHILGIHWSHTANTLAVALAPLAIIGLIPHAVTGFTTRTAHTLSNEVSTLLGANWQIAPLAARGDAWFTYLNWLPYLAMLWTLWLLWQRSALLTSHPSTRFKIFFYGSLPAITYMIIFAIKVLALVLMDGTEHAH